MTTLLLLRADATAIPLAGCSVDAIVTDPPYSLSFMGRSWDNHGGPRGFQAWCELWAREALRVLRPGGHLLAFGGTRTYHRLACGLEDAGFEIRDSLRNFVSGDERPAPNAWIYSQGFPKSRDIAKDIDRMAPRREMFAGFAQHYAERRAAAGLTHAQICQAGRFFDRVNHGGASVNWERGHNVPTRGQWGILQPMLGLSDEWAPLIERIEAERDVVGEVSVPVGHAFAGSTYGGDSSSQDVALTAPATPEAERWQGWGTALKPSFEPIVLARKPLVGTVAASVLAWGTGGLHVDACRVGSVVLDSDRRTSPRSGARTAGFGMGATDGGERHNAAGRWPSNSLWSHAEGCEQVGTRRVKGITGGTGNHAGSVYGARSNGGAPVRDYADPDGTETVPAWSCVPGCPVAELDRQSGSSRSSGSAGVPFTNAHEAWVRPSHANYQPTPDTGYRDTGGASRFFPTFRYTAKAGSAERPVGDDGTGHPTVKPLELMRWLVRLVTPPGGLVLDPFCGSGPTLEAALIEGFRSVGLDSDATAVHLTAKRLAKPIPLTFGFDW